MVAQRRIQVLGGGGGARMVGVAGGGVGFWPDTVLTRRNGGENYLAEPKLFIFTNWRFVIGGSIRIFKFMAIYNWRK